MSTTHGVELVAWPQQRVLRDRLALAAIPRVLLVDADAAAPEDVGLDEDWLRLPAEDDEVEHRCERLALIVHELHRLPLAVSGTELRRGTLRRELSRSEAAVMRLLLSDTARRHLPEDVVRVGWQGGTVTDAALQAMLYRLRRRVVGLGLRIDGSPRRGFRVVVGA